MFPSQEYAPSTRGPLLALYISLGALYTLNPIELPNFDVPPIQIWRFAFALYNILQLFFICIASATLLFLEAFIMFFDYVFTKFENEIDKIYTFATSSLEELYEIFEIFFQVIDNYIKIYRYKVKIVRFKFNRKNIKYRIYIDCTKFDKIKINKSKDKRNVDFTRNKYFVKI